MIPFLWPALIQPVQLAGGSSCLLAMFSDFLKRRAQLRDARHDLFVHAKLNAGKECSERNTKDCGVGKRRPERRETVPFFVPGYLSAIVRTQQESHLLLAEAGSPAI